MNPDNLSHLTVVPTLPDLFKTHNEPIPANLIGATIKRFGTLTKEEAKRTAGIEGGGLVIDFESPNLPGQWRVVFSLSELGMWLVWEGQIAPAD